jgi:hypothetical protein
MKKRVAALALLDATSGFRQVLDPLDGRQAG